ncbi:inositol monophosphatase family protein [Chryseosolibacter indicus]|uniref:Inositol-1-monophosphatase n=1 Tax=Chryseosolibacter indicus TaxID=2782351 RepID=A0ABS5VTW6_9BACT|nr:inositol monophosphatase family protein [Chryseosolibacter indicus]MBT1704651.1 inositol monophosphatase [Chryseosolibacter indicus]
MNLQTIQKGVIKASLEVGDFIRKEGMAFDRTRIEQKTGFNNLVSYVDKEAEKRLVDALHKLVPEAGFVTEEGTVEQNVKEEFKWIIDPLDGTTNFLHGMPTYAISIGLTRGDDTILGVVYHIGRDECFHAIENDAAYCNEKQIRVSAIPTLRESLLATGFPYNHSGKSELYLDIIKHFLKHTHGIRRLGSAAIDLAYVACGRLEGFFEYNLNPWDVAAGAFIVQQAGGKVTDFKGGKDFVFGNELCAANMLVHEEMLQLIKTRWGY